MANQVLLGNDEVAQLLRDCVSDEKTDRRESARQILKEKEYVARAWGYNNDGSPCEIFTDSNGGELWRETK